MRLLLIVYLLLFCCFYTEAQVISPYLTGYAAEVLGVYEYSSGFSKKSISPGIGVGMKLITDRTRWN